MSGVHGGSRSLAKVRNSIVESVDELQLWDLLGLWQSVTVEGSAWLQSRNKQEWRLDQTWLATLLMHRVCRAGYCVRLYTTRT